jgi:hypothetical protein
MPLTLKQAAEETGKTKQAIQQAIKSGKISAKKNDFNTWEIDASELFRVYKPVNRIDTNIDNQLDGTWYKELAVLSPALQTKIIELTVNAGAKDKEIALLEKRASGLEVERDNWRDQAQRLSLTYQKPIEKSGATAELKRSTKQLFGLAVGISLLVLGALFWPDIIIRLTR